MMALAEFAAGRTAVVGGEVWLARADGAWCTLRAVRVHGWVPWLTHLLVWPNQREAGWTFGYVPSNVESPRLRHEFRDGRTRDEAMRAALRWAGPQRRSV